MKFLVATNANIGGCRVVIERGGTISEGRLFIYDAICSYKGEPVIVKKKVLPDIEETIFRHRQRYHLPAFFLRRDMRVLDFPCGSGYGSETLGIDTIDYHGMDIDGPTIAYCKRVYSDYPNRIFWENDLTIPKLPKENFDLIACIEGIEHIEEQYQGPLIKAFYESLSQNGTLIVSSPEKTNDLNKWHKHEMTLKEFTFILTSYFKDVQILTYRDTLHNGTISNCFYGVCRK